MELCYIKNSVIMTLPDVKKYTCRYAIVHVIDTCNEVRIAKKIHIFTDFEPDKIIDSVNYISNLFSGGKTYSKFIIHGKYTNEQICYIKQKTEGVCLDFYHIDKLVYKMNDRYTCYMYEKEYNRLDSWCEYIKE